LFLLDGPYASSLLNAIDPAPLVASDCGDCSASPLYDSFEGGGEGE
jgi:hypothetical protein